MASVPATTLLSDASIAWKLLSGVVCLYKPLGYSRVRMRREFTHRMARELNDLGNRPRQERIEVIRVDENEKLRRIPMEKETVLYSFEDGRGKKIEVVKGLSYSDHPLIAGPRFLAEDIKIMNTQKVNRDVSGVHLIGVNSGNDIARKIFQSRWLRTYELSGRFGIATDTFFHTGRVIDKATYGQIKRHIFQRFLASSESAHQRLSFISAGVPLDSDQAYELASQGLIRPDRPTDTIVYSIKCIHFKPPDFTLEVKTINEDPEYLKRLIHEIGIKMKSLATCTKIHCTNFGPFGLKEALLLKHWTLQYVLDNIKESQKILENFDLTSREVWVDKPLSNLVIENEEDDDDDDAGEDEREQKKV